jgi:hypothetical protein
MELHVSPEHRARADARLAEWGIDEGSLLIGLNPGATMEVKRWPVERFAAVGRELTTRYDARIMVLGGPGDEQRAEVIARAVPGAVSVAGKTRLGETAALLRHCRLLISGDTGPLHMAVALGVPVVGLFGPTNPAKYGPWVEHPPRSKDGSCGGTLFDSVEHPPRSNDGSCGGTLLDQSDPDSRLTRATVLRHEAPCGHCERPCVHTISVEECVAAAASCLKSLEQPLLAPV